MPVTRCPDQSDDTLEAFYQWIGTTQSFESVGTAAAMLHLISELNALFKQIHLWGVTSHAKLILQNSPSMPADSCVMSSGFSGAGQAWYSVSYLLPARKRPWHNAEVMGHADSLVQAVDYLLIAMRESEGWLGNRELEEHLVERKLG